MIYNIESEIKRPDVFFYSNIVYSTRMSMWGRDTVSLFLNLIHPHYGKHKFEKVPTIVWLEGGAWSSTSPYYRIPELSYYAYNGFAVADVRYSVGHQSTWPACLEDAKCAIRFLRAHAEEYGIDENNIFVGGESAGAHLAAMVGATGDEPRFKTKEYADYSDAVNGVVTWYCPGDMHIAKKPSAETKDELVNFLAANLTHNYVYDYPQQLDDISPDSHVKENMPPFLMFHGDKDPLVPVQCSINLHNRLVEKGNKADLYIIKDAMHATIEFTQEEIQKKILAFYKENIK